MKIMLLLTEHIYSSLKDKVQRKVLKQVSTQSWLPLIIFHAGLRGGFHVPCWHRGGASKLEPTEIPWWDVAMPLIKCLCQKKSTQAHGQIIPFAWVPQLPTGPEHTTLPGVWGQQQPQAASGSWWLGYGDTNHCKAEHPSTAMKIVQFS